ncbi:MAG TPA: hypothetical protein VFH39_03390 [Candidatus Saccharimonadales bacterium]|nr:hypothetical protein [Candidatus Saccharimonadales bacterium]
MEHHIYPGQDLEGALELIDDPVERAHLIDEAYANIGHVALEPVVVEDDYDQDGYYIGSAMLPDEQLGMGLSGETTVL